MRFTVLFLTFLTGYTGLVYEVTWHRYLANLLGSQARASAIILAVFLGGLSIGYYIFGNTSHKSSGRSLLKLTGWIEIGIGIWCILFPVLYEGLWQKFLTTEYFQTTSISIDIAVCIFLIGLPTIFMGATLPLLTQALSRSISDATTLHAKIYAVNTGGAFLGCITAGFYLLPSFGLPLTLLGTAPINIVAGLIFLLLGSTVKDTQEEQDTPETNSSLSVKAANTLALVSGFYALSTQVILIRLVGLSIGASEYAFSLIVSLYIYMLARGAWRLSKQKVHYSSLLINQSILFISICLVYLSVSYWPYAAHVLRSLFTPETPSFYAYHIVLFVILGLLLLIPLSAMGKTMPLVFSSVNNKAETLGRNVGRLYGLNTVGCVFGALLSGYFLLFYFNLDILFKLSIFFIAISVLLASPRQQPKTAAIALCFLFCIVTAILPLWNQNYLGRGTFRKREARPYSYLGPKAFYRPSSGTKVIDYKDGPNTTVAIIEFAEPATKKQVRALYVNGKSDGATSGPDLVTTRLLAHLPATFESGNSNNAAVIGFGTGITVDALRSHQDYDIIDVIEISPVVKKFAPYFDFANGALSQANDIKWHILDAYKYLSMTKKKYDVIISEPSNPWVTGVERLYARDFYEIVRKKLSNGGIYAQWFHLYAVTPKAFQLVLKTYTSAFPHVRIFKTRNDLVILGSDSAFTNSPLSIIEEKLAKESVARELGELEIRSLTELLAFELPFSAEMAARSPIHTLEFPRLAFQAGRDFFKGGRADLQSFLTHKAFNEYLLEAESNSLFTLYFDSADEEKRTAFLFQTAKRRCPGTPADYIKSWENAPPLCKRTLTQLSELGKISNPETTEAL